LGLHPLSKHESGDRLRESLIALMRVVVRVGYVAKDSEQRIMIAGLFKFFDVARKDLGARATLRYGIASELVSVLERSQRWGRIKAEVFCAMKSKYAVALYEMLELRRNMDRCVETFSVERFRELLSVKTDTYKLGPDFQRFVINPAVLEVNGLSDMGVQIDLHRKHTRAPFHAVTMAWWRKSPEEMAGAIRERNRSKVGRMARLKGAVESVAPRPDALAGPGAPMLSAPTTSHLWQTQGTIVRSILLRRPGFQPRFQTSQWRFMPKTHPGWD
jgi:Initiator Replication protein